MEENIFSERLLSERQVADLIGATVKMLQQRRWKKDRAFLDWINIGQLVRYRYSDVKRLIEHGTNPTPTAL